MRPDLFPETIDSFHNLRAMCWYQPFGSLMLHGKIETREWNRNFNVRGKFLIYTAKKPATSQQLQDWCTPDNLLDITLEMENEPSRNLNGYAIALADLVDYRIMKPEDERKCFVKYSDKRKCLIFNNIQRIEPFVWDFGSQGISFVPESEKKKIKILQ